MISITPSLKHMAWSNQKIFQEISLLPKEIYDLRASAGEWTIGEDGVVTFIGDNGDEQKTRRSIVLSQAVTHTAEHKGQLATILCAHGFDLNLDNFDMWSFESTNP